MVIGIEPEVGIEPAERPAQEPAKPKIEAVQSEDEYGKFVAEPLERGFGHTLGNALRRVLLGTLPGAAVTGVQIDGVQHEYSVMPHVKEDVSELILNIKGLRLRAHGQGSGTLRLDVQGPGQVTGGDVQPSADFDVVNPEVCLASLDSSKARLSMTLHAEAGTGFRPATPVEGMPIGYIPIDAVFTPTRKVNYTVDKTRVGQVTDYERLTLELWTDGSKTPLEAVREAAEILLASFTEFASLGIEAPGQADGQGAIGAIPPERYNMPIEKLELSARTHNCLKRGKINLVGEILEKSDGELLKIKNFGDKSLQELKGRLRAMGMIPTEKAADLAAAEAAAPAAAPVPAEPAETPAKRERDKAQRSKETLKDLAALRALLGGSAQEEPEQTKKPGS